ncbi:tyrosine aminotransferase [Trypanosoma rangeli]|uniref:Tyrosine aminotransferase n=1 Tax=Trypanosoma rangeli TaxID=5698 RepID=A0A3R7JTQ6_TRYRA|nr:tyrosine aminotransferase [Trypanosoma rangeli]RNE95304.1 tyrosine aminotransferase [Trypanosoma rangeli]|eukprot:RNE95304.1 tyrosine aminotransferase [Trypanosoma rangeli]
MPTQKMGSWDVSMSSHAGLVVNPIRSISDNAKPSPSPKPIIKLSVGDPTLDKNLLTPGNHLEKLKKVVDSQDWNGYLPTVGAPEACDAIATWWRNSFVHNKQLKSSIVKDNVVVCSGGSHGILMAITAICDAGDYVLVPKPGFPHYETVCKAYGIGMHFYNCRADNNWEADLDEIRRVKDDKTKLIVITNPSNPCGSNFRRQHVEDLVRTCRGAALAHVRGRDLRRHGLQGQGPQRDVHLRGRLRLHGAACDFGRHCEEPRCSGLASGLADLR